MARIIRVEDEPDWIEFTRGALADHRVDSASNYAQALELIQGNAPYDIALVDLSLGRDDDRLGGEILDLLKTEYPSTRRIVITGRPPVGGLSPQYIRTLRSRRNNHQGQDVASGPSEGRR